MVVRRSYLNYNNYYFLDFRIYVFTLSTCRMLSFSYQYLPVRIFPVVLFSRSCNNLIITQEQEQSYTYQHIIYLQLMMLVLLQLTPCNHPYCSNYTVQTMQDLHFVANSMDPNILQDTDAFKISKTRDY